MAVTLYLRVLADQRKEYESRGWTFVCDLWPMGSWKQCLVRKVCRPSGKSVREE